MSKASKTSAPETVEVEGYEGHIANMGDGYTAAFETYTVETDLAPYSKACPTTGANVRTGASCSKGA